MTKFTKATKMNHPTELLSVLLVLATVGCAPAPLPPEDFDQLQRPLERPIGDVHRDVTFECDPAMDGTTVAWAADDGSSRVHLETTSQACRFHLVFERDGMRERISTAAGGYLLPVAAFRPDGDGVVCASDVVHRQVSGSAHEIRRVQLSCAWRLGGVWTPLTPILEPLEWAPWPRAITLHPDDTLELVYVHDFSFQFFNINDAGRPETDGTYALRYDLRTQTVLDDTQQSTRVTEEAFQAPWEPSPERIAELNDAVALRFHNSAFPEDTDRDGDVDRDDERVVVESIGVDEMDIDVVRFAPDVDGDSDIDDDDLMLVRSAL